MKTKIFLMITSLIMLSFFSCMKYSGLNDQSSIDLADDDAVSFSVFDDVFSTADYAAYIVDQMGKSVDTKSGTVVADSCPVITVTKPTSEAWPKIVTVDYGTNCVGLNDNIRSGKILIEITGPRPQAGSKRTVTFDNYYFNGIKVEGTKIFENVGYNSNQNLLIKNKLIDGKLTLPNGKFIERSFTYQREWTAGFLTKNIFDDECLITGSATGKNINGIAYSNTIISALQWKRACSFIVSGV